MNKEDQIIAIAEFDGWIGIRKTIESVYGFKPEIVLIGKRSSDHGETYVSNYLGDLNVLWPVLERLDDDQIVDYVANLCNILDFAQEEDWTSWDVFHFSQATAEEVAEALLKTLNLWVE